MNRPSPDMLDAWLRLADALAANGDTEPFDLELHLEQAAGAARGLRKLVEAVRSADSEHQSAAKRYDDLVDAVRAYLIDQAPPCNEGGCPRLAYTHATPAVQKTLQILIVAVTTLLAIGLGLYALAKIPNEGHTS